MARKTPTPSTIITCNAAALSRAADAILAQGVTPSKNAILNALAAAIAGPGHDWGFLRNAPGGSFTQPGLAQAFGETRHDTAHSAHTDDSDDTSGARDTADIHGAVETGGAAAGAACDTVVITDWFCDVRRQGLDDAALYADRAALEGDLRAHGLDPAEFEDSIHAARDCVITANFQPEAWVNDNAVPVDAEGETRWRILARDLSLDALDLDYLKESPAAPDWVRDWNGPFTITLDFDTDDADDAGDATDTPVERDTPDARTARDIPDARTARDIPDARTARDYGRRPDPARRQARWARLAQAARQAFDLVAQGHDIRGALEDGNLDDEGLAHAVDLSVAAWLEDLPGADARSSVGSEDRFAEKRIIDGEDWSILANMIADLSGKR